MCYGESLFMPQCLQLLTPQRRLRTQQLRVVADGRSVSQVWRGSCKEPDDKSPLPKAKS